VLPGAVAVARSVYQVISKPFGNSNGLIAISLAQTWLFRKRDEQTITKNIELFHSPDGVRSPSPTIFAVVDVHIMFVSLLP